MTKLCDLPAFQSVTIVFLTHLKSVFIGRIQLNSPQYYFPRFEKSRLKVKALCLMFGIRGVGKGTTPISSAIFHVAPITFLFCLLS